MNYNYSKEEISKLFARFDREYLFLGRNTKLLVKISQHFMRWLETQHPDWLDSLVVLCDKNDVEVSGVLLEQLAIASSTRLKREYTKIYRQEESKAGKAWVDKRADKNIFILVYYCGKTKEEACLLAAGWLSEYFPDCTKKASTLEKRYPNWERENKDSVDRAKYLVSAGHGWTKAQQLAFLDDFPSDISEDLKGNRRF
jgi:hypothetical protein